MLATTPPVPVVVDGRLVPALMAGRLHWDPLRYGPTSGRARRWSYAAAADRDQVAIGCAIVDVGLAGNVFVWLRTAAGLTTWERNLYRGPARAVGATPMDGSRAQHRDGEVHIDPRGGMTIDVATAAGRLTAHLEADPGTPGVCVTDTPRGGWNVTQKEAGYRVRGRVTLGDDAWQLGGEGWRDWTAGRQDRHTDWRWAAGAGHSANGRRVGLNLSTGMNGASVGEDLVWWEGTPYAVSCDRLAPTGQDPRGPWEVGGPGWSLQFTPQAVREDEQNLLVVRSSYVQPIGLFRGTLPGPDGAPIAIAAMAGVTEDHRAVW